MNILSVSLVSFLLLDQLLALITPFSSGLGLFLFILTLAIHAIPPLIKSNNLIQSLKGVKRSNLLWTVLIIIYSIIAATIAPCNGYIVFSLATAFLMLISWNFIQAYTASVDIKIIIDPRHALVGLVIIFWCLCAAKSGFDIYSALQHTLTNRPSGLYLEPSHLIIYASPLIFTVLNNKETRVFGVMLAIFISVFAFSLTLVLLTLMIMASYTLHVVMTRKSYLNSTKNFCIMFLTTILFAITLQGSYITDRLVLSKDPSKEPMNLSTQVYLNGWLLAKETFRNTSGVGLGLGSMGCSRLINENENTLSSGLKGSDGSVICARSGSFLISKIISELGMLGLLLMTLIIHRLFSITIFGLKHEFNLPMIGALCLLITQLFIRGMAYFSAPIVFCLIVVFLSIKEKQKI